VKVLLIVPGSGDTFYCGNCFRDRLYAQALRHTGHEVVVMPLYLPVSNKSFGTDTPLFFPATSYYIAQKFFKKRTVPQFFKKILETPSMLRMAASLSGATSAKGMEQMTLSMIKGDDLHFSKEINKMIEWMVNHNHPNIIHLSTSMLIGIAKVIKNQINIPIVCSLQDEEIWIDTLNDRYARQAWDLIGKQAKYVDRFITSSEFYKSKIHSKIKEIKKIEVVYPGVDVEKYRSHHIPKEPTIGFFYRMSHQNGLDILAQAFVKIKQQGGNPQLKLKIGGGYTRENRRFIHQIRKTLKPFAQDVTWIDHYAPDDHASFYKDISLICVPVRHQEAIGLYLCEAFAAGIPAVSPDTGSFSEILSNGGVLYQPNTPDALANAIETILINRKHYTECRNNAQQRAQMHYRQEATALQLLQTYELLLAHRN
jgi:glycosyltransferase involved in cell wall biosynthesis